MVWWVSYIITQVVCTQPWPQLCQALLGWIKISVPSKTFSSNTPQSCGKLFSRTVKAGNQLNINSNDFGLGWTKSSHTLGMMIKCLHTFGHKVCFHPQYSPNSTRFVAPFSTSQRSKKCQSNCFPHCTMTMPQKQCQSKDLFLVSTKVP